MNKRDKLRKLKDEARNVTEELKETTASKAGRVRDASNKVGDAASSTVVEGSKNYSRKIKDAASPVTGPVQDASKKAFAAGNSSSGTAEGRIQEGLGFDDFRCQRPPLDHSGDVGQWPVNRNKRPCAEYGQGKPDHIRQGDGCRVHSLPHRWRSAPALRWRAHHYRRIQGRARGVAR